ncbi:C40 family peptidase [Pseudarthrobacter sp. BIM B-2242]|uniref:C40 family peptidase n=1 Tax=Pseudarthrobacter sp. BIM B-2242 TaxID=2772401 RepID=UPI00168ADE8D|nr:C40 family peptidase [Pseudarthrobacter sp. BIM B-2242]QOD05758.1 C40 family peptidase [Pseudarthrobacter sp. BIM B-2242]
MTMTDAISQINQIQATITQLSTGRPPAPAAAAPSAANSTAFAQALTAAATTPANGAAAATAPAAPATAVPGTATGDAVVAGAKKYLGVPYVWGGTNPATGLDCSGLVQRVYKDLGIDLPRVAIDQGNAGTTVPNLASAKPGDLLVMNNGGHIGIFMGNNQYIHAPQPGDKVRIDDIPAGFQFDKITRIIPDAPAAAAPAAPGMTDLLSSLQASLLTGAAA